MNIYKISEHKDEIITGLLKNSIWSLVVTIIPLIWALLVNQYSVDSFENKNLNTYVVIITVVCIILSIISISLSCVIWLKRKKKVVPLTNFRVKFVEAELLINSREDIKSTLYYELIVNEDKVEYFEKEIFWTGETYYRTELSEADGNYSFEDLENHNSLHKYRVNFNQIKKRGEEASFKLTTYVSDSKCEMLPVYSYMVKHQIDKLVLNVRAVPGMIKNVKSSIYVDMARQMRVGEAENIPKKTVAGYDSYTYEVTPTLLYRYFIEFEFTNK